MTILQILNVAKFNGLHFRYNYISRFEKTSSHRRINIPMSEGTNLEGPIDQRILIIQLVAVHQCGSYSLLVRELTLI